MRITKPLGLALALSGAVLFGAAGLSAAQKKASGPPKGAVEAGAKVFSDKGCAACHAVKAGEKKGAPSLAKIGADSKWPRGRIVQMVRDPKKTLNTTRMPAYDKSRLSDHDLDNLLWYLSSLK